METTIHPSAIIETGAKIGKGVSIGAFSIIGKDVTVGDGTRVDEHVVIRGMTHIGRECRIFPFAVVGAEPQHFRYKGENTETIIGDRVTLRESVTIHRGTTFGGNVTRVGDDCYLMAYCHVAHDCLIGSGVTMANGVQLAGHVIIEDYVTIGGLSAVTQFGRVGRYCYIGGCSILRKDLAPFLSGKGNDFEVQGINMIGLERRGYSPSTISRLKKLYKIFFLQNLTVSKALEKISEEIGDTDEVKLFLDFAKSSKLGLTR